MGWPKGKHRTADAGNQSPVLKFEVTDPGTSKWNGKPAERSCLRPVFVSDLQDGDR